MARTAAKAAPDVDEELDAFVEQANENQWNAIAILLWLNRHQNPEMSVTIFPEDLKGFRDCLEYLEVEPKVSLFRPGGVPARDPVPATKDRAAIPARPAIPARREIVLQMTDKDGNAIRPIENNEQDYQQGAQARKLKNARENAYAIADQLLADLASNTFSSNSIQEAATALKLLARQ